MMVVRFPRPPRGLVRGATHAGALAAAVAIAACSSPSARFYTLGADSAAGSAAPVRARTSAAPAWLIEVEPIDVPLQASKSQMVVQTGPTQVKVLEQERWASPPGAEIQRAVSTTLTRQLGTIDVYGTAHPDATPVYRVNMSVQRFESWPGSHALIDVVWSVQAVRGAAVMTCRSVVSEPVGDGYDALVEGHRGALQQISMQLGSALQAMASAPQSKGTSSAGKVGVAAVPACPSANGAVAGN